MFVGLVKIIGALVRLGLALRRKYARQPFDLVERYGKGSWVFVTGSTRGIGLQYCKYIAEHGLNVILTGRNKEILEKN
jgi:FlaA1/EpsC-like NDP-sugar epimerase